MKKLFALAILAMFLTACGGSVEVTQNGGGSGPVNSGTSGPSGTGTGNTTNNNPPAQG